LSGANFDCITVELMPKNGLEEPAVLAVPQRFLSGQGALREQVQSELTTLIVLGV
jgi:hypothetical protein